MTNLYDCHKIKYNRGNKYLQALLCADYALVSEINKQIKHPHREKKKKKQGVYICLMFKSCDP